MNFTVEPALVESARSNSEALDRLIEVLWPEVYRVALGIVRDSTAAEDVAQEACAAIARSLPQLKSGEAFYGWMYRIAGRCAVSAAKRIVRAVAVDAEIPARERDTDALVDLRDALMHLPLMQRTAVVLYYYAGLSSSEIGSALDLPSATVRFHLLLARRQLRGMLSTEEVPAKERCADV